MDHDRVLLESLERLLRNKYAGYRSGLEILAWMREQSNLPRTFVAVLTGSNQPADFKRAHELGADTYLVKPPTPKMITDVISRFKLN